MSNQSNIATLILAAGSSRRMGTPKQLLPWKQTTLLGHTIEIVLELNIKNTFVVLGANAKLITPEIERYPIQMIQHTDWQNGLGTSIAFGVKYIQNLKNNIDGILIVLADQPLIDSTHLNALIEVFLSKKHKIITTSYHKNKEGVPAVFDVAYFDDLKKLTDDFGAKTLIKNNTTFSVEASNKILDLDTKEEYEKLIELTKGL